MVPATSDVMVQLMRVEMRTIVLVPVQLRAEVESGDAKIWKEYALPMIFVFVGGTVSVALVLVTVSAVGAVKKNENVAPKLVVVSSGVPVPPEAPVGEYVGVLKSDEGAVVRAPVLSYTTTEQEMTSPRRTYVV